MITEKLLEILVASGMIVSDVFFTDYQTSRKNLNKLNPERVHNKIAKMEAERLERKKFINLLNYLARQGLVDKKNGAWKITQKGKNYLEKLKSKKRAPKPIPKQELSEGKLKVIIFDIPEIDSRKRNWIRRSLANMNFEILQKSVWIGSGKLPKEFLENLRELNLLSCVHIFEVNKKGSIE